VDPDQGGNGVVQRQFRLAEADDEGGLSLPERDGRPWRET